MKVRPLSPCEKGDRRTELIGPRYPLRMEPWTTVDYSGHECTFFRFRESRRYPNTFWLSRPCKIRGAAHSACSCALPVLSPKSTSLFVYSFHTLYSTTLGPWDLGTLTPWAPWIGSQVIFHFL
jgi:hypothetical protein